MDVALYARRAPERTTLHEIVRENLETFIAQCDAPDSGRKPLPKYVKDAFRKYLSCGMPQEGFWRVRCPG